MGEEKLGEKQKLKNGSDCPRCGSKKTISLKTALTRSKDKKAPLKKVLDKSSVGAGQSKLQLEESITVGIVLAGTKKTVQQNVQKQNLMAALAQGNSKSKLLRLPSL